MPYHLQGRKVSREINQRKKAQLADCFSWFLAWPSLRPWRWMWCVPPKHKSRKHVRYLGYCHQAYEMIKIRLNESFNTVYYIIIIIILLLLFWLYSPLLELCGRFFSFLILYTVGRTPWTGDHHVARPLPTHRTTLTQNKRIQYRHLCFEWDPNPRPQLSSEQRQFILSTARPLWLAVYFIPLSKTYLRHTLSTQLGGRKVACVQRDLRHIDLAFSSCIENRN
jgi:hypothetical protein